MPIGEHGHVRGGNAVRRLAIIRSSSYVLSPAEYNVQELGLAKALLEHGICTDVYMAGRVNKPEVTSLVETPDVSVRLILLPFFELPGKQALFPDILRLLKKERYDVIQVHEYSQVTSVLVAVYGKRRGIPVVICQGGYRNSLKFSARLLQPIYDITLLYFLKRNIALSIAKTDRAAKYLHEKGFSDVTICPVGLETDLFTTSPPLDVRAKYGLTKDEKILLYVGTLEKRRNPAFLIQTYLGVLRSRSDITLLLAGDGPEKAACKQLARRSAGEAKIKFIGRVAQDELPSLYAEAYLLLLPSSYEIYGMVIMEAMYFGVPVITTATAGSDDLIENGADGIVLNGLDVSTWVASILNLLQDTAKRDTLSSMAKEKIRRHYVWEKTSGGYFGSYKRAVQMMPIGFSLF